jgi:hypothetical protein
MAAPAPTLCSVLLPSVKICMVLSSSSPSSRIVVFVSSGDLKELGGFFYFNVNWSQACDHTEGFV